MGISQNIPSITLNNTGTSNINTGIYNKKYLVNNGAIGYTTGNFSGISGVIGYAQGLGISMPALSNMQKYLLQSANAKVAEAVEYRDAILLRTPVKAKEWSRPYTIPKGTLLYPIIIGFTPEPTSFDWFLDESKECKEDWTNNILYEIPSKHKFLDSNILPGNGYIVPIDLVIRPIDLKEERFLFSWYGGFVLIAGHTGATGTIGNQP